MIERPRLRADQLVAGDRLLVADLPADAAVPAMPLVEAVEVTEARVRLSLAGREVTLPVDSEVVVERIAGGLDPG